MSNLSQKGFSFIEIIVVLAIVAIISVLASSFYTRFLTQNSVSNTTDHIISQMRRAQIYAMTGKQTGGNWGVKYALSPKQATFYLGGDSAFDENYAVNDNITVSPVFDILFAHYTGAPTIVLPAGAPFPLVITIDGNNSTESITINSQGIVSKN